VFELNCYHYGLSSRDFILGPDCLLGSRSTFFFGTS